MIVTRKEAHKLMLGTSGRIFSATFKKSNGEVREMVCRLGVRKGVTGAGRKYKPIEYGLVGVFDMQNDGFRMINLNTLTKIKVNGVEYSIN
jgi:hypothetical protein